MYFGALNYKRVNKDLKIKCNFHDAITFVTEIQQ